MADQEEPKDTGKPAPTKTEVPAVQAQSPVLSGAEKYADGQVHAGIAVLVTSDGKPSTLMIPDVTKVKDGGGPIYITKPIRITGKNLKGFLTAKKITLPKEVSDLIEDSSISCEAFYFTTSGPLLMMFQLKFDQGLIKTLTKDDDLANLFDIQGASVRVFRCAKESFPVLEQYAAELSG